MSIQVYPTPSTSSAAGYAVTASASNTTYNLVQAIETGVYTIGVSPTNASVTINYYNESSILTTVSITSGTATVNLGSAATGIYIHSNTANTTFLFTKTGTFAIANGISGTLDTITTTSTYNQTGKLFVLAVGAGGGGGGGRISGNTPGGGAGGGAATSYFGYVNTATSVTIGASGTGGAGGTNASAGTEGGFTSFGNYVTSAGGNGGVAGSNSGLQYVGASGTEIINPALSVKSGTNGNGGGGNYSNYTGSVGGGSGIGTGGAGGNLNSPMGGAGNGYGAGGGGGHTSGNITPRDGGLGSAGVVYVLRGF